MVVYKNLDLSGLKKLAKLLAKKLSNKKAVIGLVGPLGAGKTTFAKAFAQSLGIKRVKSPSFIISQVYRLKERNFYHIDFYRLKSDDELEHLGLEELFQARNLALIEWVDKFEQIKKRCNLIIKIKIKKEDRRDVSILD